jgi:hypothetical protein
MANETFNKRFKQLVQDLSDTELGYILGLSADAARKMRHGDIKSLKLQAALRLARNLEVSPWYIGCEAEPEAPLPQTRGKRRTSSAAEATEPLGHTPVGNAANTPDILSALAKLQEEVQEMRSEQRATNAAVRNIEKLLAKRGSSSATSSKS